MSKPTICGTLLPDGSVCTLLAHDQSDHPHGHPVPTTGAFLIFAERQRQIVEEGYSAEHDDSYGENSQPQEMALAAACYALPHEHRDIWMERGMERPDLWPWHPAYWRPTPDDRVRELTKAGALIAAEIDRLQRLNGGNE